MATSTPIMMTLYGSYHSHRVLTLRFVAKVPFLKFFLACHNINTPCHMGTEITAQALRPGLPSPKLTWIPKGSRNTTFLKSLIWCSILVWGMVGVGQLTFRQLGSHNASGQVPQPLLKGAVPRSCSHVDAGVPST